MTIFSNSNLIDGNTYFINATISLTTTPKMHQVAFYLFIYFFSFIFLFSCIFFMRNVIMHKHIKNWCCESTCDIIKMGANVRWMRLHIY